MLTEEEKKKLKYLPTVNKLLDMIKEYGELTALCDAEKDVTYSELYSRIGFRRAFFEENGISKNAIVAIFDRNTVNAVELFLAVTSSGRTAIILPSSLTEDSLKGIIFKFDIEAIFCSNEFMPLTSSANAKVFSASSFGDAYFPENSKVSADTRAAIFFTGGTTGVPKGAVLSHGALMRGAFNGVFMTGGVMHKRYYAMLPFSHVFGMIRGMLACLYTGSSVYVCENMKAVFRDLPLVKPTTMVLVPGLVELLLSVAKSKGIEALGGELETIISGAANVPARLMKSFSDFGISLLAGYGLTETANLVSGNADTSTKPDSVGIIYPETEYKVVDGELWIKGDSLFSGYYGNEEETAACMSDGWFKTGDLVRFDDDGYMYIVGRIKNLIILSNGENVSPESIEELFYKEPTIKDCLVKEEQFNGNSVIGIEILPFMPMFEGKSQEEIYSEMKKITDKINSSLPSYMKIRKISVRETDFPRTGSLKIARNKI